MSEIAAVWNEVSFVLLFLLLRGAKWKDFIAKYCQVYLVTDLVELL